MSDDNTSQTNDEFPTGGWKQPSTPGAWRTPEREEAPQGWRVPTLPKELTQEPQSTGDWHLPDPSDTVFTEEDEIEILSPEDQLLNLINDAQSSLSADEQAAATSSSALAPEDQLFSLVSALAEEDEIPEDASRSPEDLLALLDRIEDDDLDPHANAGVRSELFALASLVEDDLAADTAVDRGTEALLSELDEAIEDAEDEVELLTTAERMVQQSQQATSDDPGAYARQMLAGLEDEDEDDGVSGLGGTFDPSAGQDDPGAYARQMLDQLGDGEDEADAFTPAPSETRMIDPRQEELARRFRETEEEVARLRQMVRNGQLTQDALREQIRSLMILDDDQVWWTVGEETDQWYKFVNDEWVLSEPPRADSTLQFATNQLLDEDARPAYDTGGGVADIRLDENFMPLPRDVPTTDPDRTVVGNSYLSDLRGTETVEHMGTYGAGDLTVPSRTQPADYGGAGQVAPPQELGGGTMQYRPVGAMGQASVESAIDSSEPPELSGREATPLADEAYEERQRNTVRALIFGALTLGAVILLVGAGAVFFATQWYNGIINRFEPQIAALQNYSPPFQSVTLLDYRGNAFATISREGQEQISVNLTDIAPNLIHAVVSIENPTYFNDPGWNVSNTIGGFFQSLTGGAENLEDPTITQEIARDLVLEISDQEYTELERIAVAGELTKRYNKEFLLRLYLNQVYFGNQSYGVQAASQFYFNRDAEDVNLPQAALLAGMIANPSLYDPVTNREVAFNRAEEVLSAMANRCVNIPTVGEHCVTQATLDSGQTIFDKAQVEIRKYQPRSNETDYPHFVNLVRGQLEAAIPNLYSIGLQVQTTIVPEVQDYMQEVLARQVNLFRENGVVTGAMVWTDVETGAIRGYVGSHDYDDEENQGFNDYARTYHRPGQTIIPLAYAAALQGLDRNTDNTFQPDEYYTPATVLWDVQMSEPSPDNPAVTQSVPVWKGGIIGPVSVRDAMVNGYNAPAVQAYNFVGSETYRAVGNALGGLFERQDLQYSWLTAIGDTPTRLVDMVEAYSTIANDGVHNNLYVIQSIRDRNGNDLPLPDALARPAEENRVLSAPVAFLMQNILSDSDSRNARFYPAGNRLILANQPTQNFVAAMPGTSIGTRDLWTIGFTDNAAVGIWLGRPDEAAMRNVTALQAAAPAWNDVMNVVARGAEPFDNPGNVSTTQICTLTGTVYDQCGAPLAGELFATSRPAPTGNPFVTSLAINTWTRERATQACPNPEDTITESFTTISNPAAVDYLRSAAGQPIARLLGLPSGFQAAPTQQCNENSLLPSVNIASPVNNQEVMGNIAVLGQVSAPANFNRYVLEYAPAGQANFIQITTQTVQQPNPGSTLGTWDTTGLGNGSYDLRLSVISNDGGFVRRTVRVTVNNPTPTPTPSPMPSPTPMVIPAATDPGLPFEPIATPTIDPF